MVQEGFAAASILSLLLQLNVEPQALAPALKCAPFPQTLKPELPGSSMWSFWPTTDLQCAPFLQRRNLNLWPSPQL